MNRLAGILIVAFSATNLPRIPRVPDQDLSGVVFLDANGNGTRDPSERGLPGVAVSNQVDVVVTGPDGEKLGPDYALLGKVTSGMDVADKIGAIITDPRTDFPDDPVLIESITVAEA